MIKTNLLIEFVELKNSVEMYLDNKLYTTQDKKSFCFGFLLQDYFLEIFKDISLNNLNKIEWYDSNLKYYKEYKEGYNLYIQSDISFSELRDIFKSIKYELKQINSNNFILECKRELIQVETMYPPGLYHSHIDNKFYLIAGSELDLPVGTNSISLQFDVLYKKRIIKIEKKVVEDENSFIVGKSFEDINVGEEDDSEDEIEDIRIKLF